MATKKMADTLTRLNKQQSDIESLILVRAREVAHRYMSGQPYREAVIELVKLVEREVAGETTPKE